MKLQRLNKVQKEIKLGTEKSIELMQWNTICWINTDWKSINFLLFHKVWCNSLHLFAIQFHIKFHRIFTARKIQSKCNQPLRIAHSIENAYIYTVYRWNSLICTKNSVLHECTHNDSQFRFCHSTYSTIFNECLRVIDFVFFFFIVIIIHSFVGSKIYLLESQMRPTIFIVCAMCVRCMGMGVSYTMFARGIAFNTFYAVKFI